MRRRRLLLIGGGHAHVEVLRSLSARSLTNTEVTLVTPHRLHRYSSSMPAALRGHFAERDGTFALDALAHAAGVTLRLGTANVIESRPTPRVRVGAEWIEGDVISLDIGSAPSMSTVAGASTHAHHVRSYEAWKALLGATNALFERGGGEGAAHDSSAPAQIVIVGGGAGGVEIALATAARARAVRAQVQVTLLEAQRVLRTGRSGGATLHQLLARAEVHCMFGARVVEVSERSVRLDDGTDVESALTVWVAGAESPRVLRESPTLPRDHDGFLRVTTSLQAVDGSPIYGAGDCVAIEGHPLDKAGVFAVREAPILADNIRAALVEQLGGAATRRTYRPQRHYLSILDTSDDRALLLWGGLALHTRWALHLKHWLDRRFVARYRPALEGGAPDESKAGRLLRVARAFLVGAAMVAVVHQPLVAVAHRWLGTPWVAFSLAPTRPLGVPALLSAMAWGGAWVALLRPLWRGRPARRGERSRSPHHISLSWAVVTCALLPTAFGAILTTLGRFPPVGAHPWRAALAALVINGAWGGVAGALLRIWRASRPSHASQRGFVRN